MRNKIIVIIANLLVSCFSAFFGIFSLYSSPIPYSAWVYISPVLATFIPIVGLITALLFRRGRDIIVLRGLLISLGIGVLFILNFLFIVKVSIPVF